MKKSKTMNVISYKLIITLFFLSSILYSQKKDVHFLMNKKNDNYLITGELDSFTDYITIYNRREYEYHQKKVKEAKKKGTYYFNSESGRDNLNIHVSKLTFEIISKKKITIEHCDFHQLELVDYNWLLTEGWKQINGRYIETGKPLSFKDIYFLSKVGKDKYISYKVGVTIIAH